MLEEWLATFAFSRSVRHAPRDFSDAVLMAELLAQLLPAGAVGLHNYPSTGRYQQKVINWDLLNRKVLMSIGCELSRQQIEDLAHATPGAITVLLVRVKQQVDKKASLSPRVKPPRSLTKKPTSALQDPTRPTSPSLPTARSLNKLQSPSSTFACQSRPPSNSIQKTTNCRSPTATSPDTTQVSPSRSAQSSRRKSLTPRSPSSPSHSNYSLSDYLPASSERPSPDSLATTFHRVLRMTDDRWGVSIESERKNSRSVGRQSVSSAYKSFRCKESDVMCPRETRGTTQPIPSLPQSSSAPRPSRLRLDLDECSIVSSDGGIDSGPAEYCEGMFVQLTFSEASGHGEALKLGRVVRNLPSGSYLIQLFKPCDPTEAQRSSEEDNGRPGDFVSTPHFIECSGNKLRPTKGLGFDPVTSVWTTSTACQHSQKHALPVSPSFAKPMSPLHQYTTTVLSRHKFSAIGPHSPIELCSIEPPARPAMQHCSVAESTTETIVPDLCAKPTVFPPVVVDVSVIMDSIPLKFAPPSKKRVE